MQREGQLQQQQGYKLGSRKRNVAAHSNAVMGMATIVDLDAVGVLQQARM